MGLLLQSLRITSVGSLGAMRPCRWAARSFFLKGHQGATLDSDKFNRIIGRRCESCQTNSFFINATDCLSDFVHGSTRPWRRAGAKDERYLCDSTTATPRAHGHGFSEAETGDHRCFGTDIIGGLLFQNPDERAGLRIPPHRLWADIAFSETGQRRIFLPKEFK